VGAANKEPTSTLSRFAKRTNDKTVRFSVPGLYPLDILHGHAGAACELVLGQMQDRSEFRDAPANRVQHPLSVV
jgi:hypothetical protein